MAEIPKPTVGEIEKYLKQWDSLENYVDQENSLNKLFFDLIPENKLIEDILIKCSTLNDFYSTNIFSIFPVAKHILQLDIDKRLQEGDLTLVNDIADVKDLNRRFYSFASKYCSHHNPEQFPIYDSYVNKVLMHFKKVDGFANFTNQDLQDYIKFRDILINFKVYYSLEQYSLKELDKYLWLLGKEFFKKQYWLCKWLYGQSRLFNLEFVKIIY